MKTGLVRELIFLSISSICLSAVCANYPEPLTSAKDLKKASPDTEMIAIADLPLRDYPGLAKFQKLKSIQFYKEGRSGATDAKLEALACVKFPRLRDIELVAAKSVTDKGLLALSRMTLKGLSLEGTSITDGGCEIIDSKMHLEGINVANCSNVTMKGLHSLAPSESLKDISFSADRLTQTEVVGLIKEFK